MKQIRACLTLVLLLQLPGCRSIGERFDAVTAEPGIRRSAATAWQQSRSIFADIPHLSTFHEGYKAGYAHVARGGDVNEPPLPQRRLGRAGSRGRADQVIVQTWLDGFSHGALAAGQDRVAPHSTFDTTALTQHRTTPHETQTSEWTFLLPPLPPPPIDEAPATGETGLQTVSHAEAPSKG